MAGQPGQPLPPGQPLEPYKPYDPLQGDYWDLLGDNWDVNPDDFLSQFKDYYGQMFDTMQGGINDWDTAWGKMLKGISQGMGGAGLGLYDSKLLDQLTGQISGNLADPESATAFGLAQDRRTGTERSAKESLTDQLAGWGRTSGVGLDMQRQLERDLAKQASGENRQLSLDIQKQSIMDAMGLEGLKGGLYEGSKGREQKGRMAELDYLAKLYGQMPGMLSTKASMYGQMPGMLNSLSGMMQYQGNLENQSQQQQFANLQNLSGQEEVAAQQKYAGEKQYAGEMDEWNQLMKGWNYQMQPYGQSNPNMPSYGGNFRQPPQKTPWQGQWW